MCGDRACDIELGHRVGATTFLVQSAIERPGDPDSPTAPDYEVAGVGQAAPIIEQLFATAHEEL